ncbi:TPR domain protein [Massariosphaeria phaeospora]|uniref:TPR domain protein n=1 Tax=Massariosphaeria phaeospora TaxID=100035 RepID=A0A7C8I161_9PLEO|nr:TPR domain protein [Massariosphaeria phaeospora]
MEKSLEMEKDSRHQIEVKASALGGLGVFATTDIPRGTRVIAESALLEINADRTAKGIVRAFERLSSPQQRCYLELHEFASDTFKRAVENEMGQKWQEIPELHRKVLAISAANAFGNVFFLGSRINHSCIPNIHFAYNPMLEKETFHAIRDIAAQEELTITYIIGGNHTRSQRQAKLDEWGFLCTCPVCEDTEQGRKKEKKRAQMLELDQKLALNIANESWGKSLRLAQNLAAIQKSEGLLTRELSTTYQDAARLCMMLGDTRMALLWTEKELEVDRYCVGEDYPDYKRGLQVVARLRAVVEDSEPVDESIIQWFSQQSSHDERCIIM